MANITVGRGACSAPFLQLTKFPGNVGCEKQRLGIVSCQLAKTFTDLDGRFCAPVPTAEGTVECCLPCPITDWVYSDSKSYDLGGGLAWKTDCLDFNVIPKATNWLNVVGMVCSVSLLISFFVLPVQKTSRHYLTVGLVVAVSLLQVSHCQSYIYSRFTDYCSWDS